jgi:hypothetical protein
MTLKIERTVSTRETRIRLSGQIRLEHLGQVRSEVEGAERPVVLDLEEVDLVDVDGVRFLNECESSGIPILRCSPYIKEWMQREQDR